MADIVTLTKTESMELESRGASRTGRAEDASRTRAFLLLAKGHTGDEALDRKDPVLLLSSGLAGH